MSTFVPQSPNQPGGATVREFRRTDRDQLTGLVNAHVAAVIPGGSVSVQGLLSYLEHEPHDPEVDVRVAERRTLIVEQRNRLVGAAHLVRYRDDQAAGELYRNTAEVRFLMFWPRSTLYPDTVDAARTLLTSCVTLLTSWAVRETTVGGAQPAPGLHGVAEQWPHVRDLFTEHGFTAPETRSREVLFARVADLPRPVGTPTPRRGVGDFGTRISAMEGDVELAVVEVNTALDSGPRVARFSSWGHLAALFCYVPGRRLELTGWLLGQAAEWLAFADITHVLFDAPAVFPAQTHQLLGLGFQPLTTLQGYVLS